MAPPAQPSLSNCSTSWLNLLAAISQYFSSISMPMAFIPSDFAAISVVPLPQNGSKTVSPGNATRLTNHFHALYGFGQGCPLTSDLSVSTKLVRSADLPAFLYSP